MLESGDNRLAVLLPAGAVALLLLLLLCCCTCYHHRSLVQGAGRLCAPRLHGKCWPQRSSVSPGSEAAAKPEAQQRAETKAEAEANEPDVSA